MNQIPLGVLMLPAQTTQHFASAFQGMTNTIAEVMGREQQQIAAQMRLAHVSRYATDITTQIDSIFTQAEQSDPTQIPEFQQKISDSFQSAYDRIRDYKDDPILTAMLNKKHGEIQLHYGTKFMDLSKAKNKQFTLSSMYKAIDEIGKKYDEAVDPKDESFYMTQMAEAVNRAEITGAIDPEKAFKWRGALEDMVVNKKLYGLSQQINNIGEMDPVSRMQLYRDIGDPTKYEGLKIQQRFEMKKKFLEMAKANDEMQNVERKAMEENVENNLLDVLAQMEGADPAKRQNLGQMAGSILADAGKTRGISSGKRLEYMKMIRDFQEGKMDSTDPEIQNDALLSIMSGRMSLTQYRRLRGVSAIDKASTLKYIYQINKAEQSAARGAQALERGNMRWNLAEMLQSAKPTGPMKDFEQSQFQAFQQGAVKATAQGVNPWDFYEKNFNLYFPEKMPVITIPGKYAAEPQSMGDIENLKLWIPEFINQGRVKEANELATQIQQATRILNKRAITQQTKKERKTR